MAASRLGGEEPWRLPETSSRTPGLCGGPARRGWKLAGILKIETKILEVAILLARGLPQSAAREWRRRFDNFYAAMTGDALRVGTTRAPQKWGADCLNPLRVNGGDGLIIFARQWLVTRCELGQLALRENGARIVSIRSA